MTSAQACKELTLRLLLLDHRPERVEGVRQQIEVAGYKLDLTCPANLDELREALVQDAWDAVLCAHQFPGGSVAAAQRCLSEAERDLPFLILTESGEEKAVQRALRQGAHDVFAGLQLERLVPALEREIREARHRSDHRAALEMLRESENRFRALAGNIPGMAFLLARDASGDRFLYVSEGGHKLLGLKPHALLTTFGLFVDAIDPEDRACLMTALNDSAERLTVLNWEGRVRARSQQRSKWVSLRSSPLRQPNGDIHWHGVALDVTRSKETETALRKSREQLAELSTYLEAAKEEERERIARDIHDELGSILVALKIEASLLAAKLPAGAEPLKGKARAIETLLDQAMGTASRVARELRPGILKEFGLQAAIECQAQDFAQRTGINCRFRCEDEGIELDEQRALTLFRIVQEALTNVAKHAHASLVVLRLYRDRRHLVLEVRDNGRGISESDISKPRSFGLRGIRERSRSLDGEFLIAASEQGGTHLVLRLPLPHVTVPPSGDDEELQRNLF